MGKSEFQGFVFKDSFFKVSISAPGYEGLDFKDSSAVALRVGFGSGQRWPRHAGA
jgi:hypothetical protein